MRAIENPELVPICPHCRDELSHVEFREMDPKSDAARSRFGVRYVYACPQCRAVLGVSHRKGFWMG